MDASWNVRLAKQPAILRKVLALSGLVPKEQLAIGWAKNVIARDVRKPLPFPDQSLEVVYTSHMLDYLYLSEAKKLLVECRRVLKPGGILRIVVEDFAPVLREYFGEPTRQDMAEELKKMLPMDRLMMRLLLRPHPVQGSLLYRVYQKLTEYHTRKWAYDAQSLSHHLSEAGFTEVRRRSFGESRIQGIEQVEKIPGVFVEGIRPPQ